MSKEHLIIQALRGGTVDRFPIWIMRQAGRYLPEYRQLRKTIDFMDLCRNPEAAAKASMMPIERFDLDAAIIFSDILVPVEAMGLEVVFTGSGPSITNPVRSMSDVQALTVPDSEQDMPFVAASIRTLCTMVNQTRPVIGFVGGPLTLGCYMVEGKGSASFAKLREFMYAQPEARQLLFEKLTATVTNHLLAQIRAGAQIVQLFDTWAGLITAEEFRTWLLPHYQEIFAAVKATDTPSILFINGSSHLLSDMVHSGAQAISIDWRQDMHKVAEELGDKVVLQGNFNPVQLFNQDFSRITTHAEYIMQAFPKRRGLVFNLGHGIHPTTPIEAVSHLVQTVRGF